MERDQTDDHIKKSDRWVTPALASEWLDRYHRHNRKLTRQNVGKLRAALRRGEFLRTGDAIRFAGYLDSGTASLLDGRHRLTAIAEEGIGAHLDIVEGLAPEAQVVMDTGKPRNFANVLELGGIAGDATLAAAVRLACQYDQGAIALAGGGDAVQFSFPMQLAWLEKNPSLAEFVASGRSLRSNLGMAPAAGVVGAWLVAGVDAAEAEVFLASALSGAMLEDGDPVLALRRYLMNLKPRSKPRSAVQLAIFIKAWNARRQGRSVTLLQWRPSVEPFPRPI